MADSITRRLITSAAKARGYGVSYIGPRNRLMKIDNNQGKTEMFFGSRPMRSSANGRMIAADKHLTLDFVAHMDVDVPPYLILEAQDENIERFLQDNGSIVVKPNDSEQSKGVTVDVRDMDHLQKAIKYAKTYSKQGRVILQKQLFGNLYRLFVLNGKFVAASQSLSAFVVGDGVSTVSELIAIKNKNPLRGKDSSSPLKFIDLTKATQFLGEEVCKILEPGKKLIVSDTASVCAGGEPMDVTRLVDERLASLVEDISSQLGLFVVGFDIICADISSFENDKYLPLLEINSCPGLKIHMYPTAGGEPINLAEKILDECFAA